MDMRTPPSLLPLELDQLGGLALTLDGLKQRDRIVIAGDYADEGKFTADPGR